MTYTHAFSGFTIGEFGVVYKAHLLSDLGGGLKTVAVKTLKGLFLSTNNSYSFIHTCHSRVKNVNFMSSSCVL